MKVIELMERTGLIQTGKAIAYIKDGLEEMNFISEVHTKTTRINIAKDQRFYDLPNEAVKILDIRCKDHNNTDGTYKSIPRIMYEPDIEDKDGF